MVAWVELLVEEPSAEAALRAIVPKVRPDLAEGFAIHAFEGVGDMLAKLPQRFRGYAKWLDADQRVVVLRDEDRADCRKLKREIEAMAEAAGLVVKSNTNGGQFAVLTRIAVEELEAWFLGDPVAMRAAYPALPPRFERTKALRDPDAVRGGTWEAVERLLRSAGYYPGGLPKIELARNVARHLDPDRSSSRSFCAFRDALRAL